MDLLKKKKIQFNYINENWENVGIFINVSLSIIVIYSTKLGFLLKKFFLNMYGLMTTIFIKKIKFLKLLL